MVQGAENNRSGEVKQVQTGTDKTHNQSRLSTEPSLALLTSCIVGQHDDMRGGVLHEAQIQQVQSADH